MNRPMQANLHNELAPVKIQKKDRPSAAPDYDVVEDKKTLAVRNKALDHMKAGPMYNSVARLMLMIGGPLLTAGLMGMITAGAGVAVTTIAVITAVGAALTVGGIVVDYVGTRSSQSGGLDQSEFNAQSTARHLVQELKANNMFMPTFENNKRGDGRSWVQATGKGQGDLQVS